MEGNYTQLIHGGSWG